MPIPALDGGTGLLPQGRFRCTMDEVRSQFVDAPWIAGATRRKLWNDFVTLNGLFASVHPSICPRVWMGGSFTSNKADPDDVDLLYLADGTVFDTLDPARRGRLNQLAEWDRSTIVDGRPVKMVRSRLGLQVDVFILVVRAVPDPNLATCTADENGYFWNRGYWDDFWQRHRTGPKGEPPTPDDATPRRGYLEVTL